MLYHAGPSSSVFFEECLKIITDSNLQIQSYKIQVQLKPKLHQLWRIALWLGKLQPSVFFKDSVSLLTETLSSSLGNSFWTSLTVFGVICYFHFVIKTRVTCLPKSRCQSDLSRVSVLANKNLRQDLMHSGCRGTAVPNVCLQAFSLFPLPSSPLDQRPVHRLDVSRHQIHSPKTSQSSNHGIYSLK